MKKRLFVTDLDGTALGGGFTPYARFPDHFSDFLDNLTANNCMWAINTTWSADGQMELVETSSVKSRPQFLMAEYGCRLARMNDSKLEFVSPYTEEMEERIADFMAEGKFLIKELCGRFIPERIYFYGHIFHFMLSQKENSKEFSDFVEPYLNNPESISSCDGKAFSVRPAFLTKGNSLREVNRLLNLSPDQVIIAGDENTDITMMDPEIANHYLCPSNASEKVKKHVLEHDGEVGDEPYGAGIIQAFKKMSTKRNWQISDE